MERLERDYSLAKANSPESLHIVQTVCFCLYSYCASLQGFEVPKVVLDYLPDFMQTTTVGAIPPYFGLPLAGRFKLQGNMDQNLLLFIAAETAPGWAFQDGYGRQMKMSNFEDRIFDILLDIQEDKPNEVQLLKQRIEELLDTSLIDYFNRWKERKGSATPYFQGNMRVHYSDQRMMAEKFIRFSLPL
eukprot:scaffold305_cov60-Attheya_sp.AAC.7